MLPITSTAAHNPVSIDSFHTLPPDFSCLPMETITSSHLLHRYGALPCRLKAAVLRLE